MQKFLFSFNFSATQLKNNVGIINATFYVAFATREPADHFWNHKQPISPGPRHRKVNFSNFLAAKYHCYYYVACCIRMLGEFLI